MIHFWLVHVSVGHRFSMLILNKRYLSFCRLNFRQCFKLSHIIFFYFNKIWFTGISLFFRSILVCFILRIICNFSQDKPLRAYSYVFALHQILRKIYLLLLKLIVISHSSKHLLGTLLLINKSTSKRLWCFQFVTSVCKI